MRTTIGMKKKKTLTVFCTLIIGFMSSLHGASQWAGSPVGNWDDNSNWNPGGFPNGQSAAAVFRLQPGTNQVVDSSSDISIGQLYLDTPGNLDIHFTNHSLIFQTTNNSALIAVSQGYPIIDTSLTVNDKYLKISGNHSSNLWLKGDISGTGGLIFENGVILFSGNNSYRKETILLNTVLRANGTGVIFPGTVSVSDGSQLFHDTSNNYSPHSFLYVVNNSYVDFGQTDQSLGSLMIIKGTVVGANATVNLTGSSHVIQVKSEAAIGIKNLILSKGGYMQFSSVNGTFDGNMCKDSFMTMNLAGNQLNLDVHRHEAFSDFSMGFNNVIIHNGSVIKNGPGSVYFSGQLGSIPFLSIQTGNVYIGTALTDIIDSSGELQVGENGYLGGFGTLGRQGNAVVHNQGTVKPGTDSRIGTLKISGSYAQSSSGTLFIKALNKNAADELVIDENGVSLDGALFLQAQTPDALHSGDQIVILDNINANTPITGKFSSFNSNLPSHLNASVQYDSNQVKVLITQR